MILGIVGSEAAKFTKSGQAEAREVIRSLIQAFHVDMVSSGHCHLGGIDIWAEEKAKILGKFDPYLIFPPAYYSWAAYKARNIKIARASDITVCISVDVLPVNYTGMRFEGCYHCAGRKVPNHIKSGSCWTTKFAREKLNRPGLLFVIENGE